MRKPVSWTKEIKIIITCFESEYKMSEILKEILKDLRIFIRARLLDKNRARIYMH